MEEVVSRVMPRPRRIELAGGEFGWSDHVILVEPASEADRLAAETLVEACRERGLQCPEIRRAQDIAESIDKLAQGS